MKSQKQFWAWFVRHEAEFFDLRAGNGRAYSTNAGRGLRALTLTLGEYDVESRLGLIQMLSPATRTEEQ